MNIRVFNAHPRHRIPHRETLACARRVLEGELVRRAELNIVFIDDRAMIRLNSAYLRRRTTTDVLSFPLGQDRGPVEGEVYVNLDQARRQARRFGISFREEIARLVIHGSLHLTGYRDRTPREKKRMSGMEDFYLFRRGPRARKTVRQDNASYGR